MRAFVAHLYLHAFYVFFPKRGYRNKAFCTCKGECSQIMSRYHFVWLLTVSSLTCSSVYAIKFVGTPFSVTAFVNAPNI